jgi:phosphoserine aminotransferase
MDRANSNLKVLEDFCDKHDWIDFLTQDKSIRSCTSVCFVIKLPSDKVKKMISLLEGEGVAYDIGSYRDAPDGLRIWAGATVEKSNLVALTHWLSWAYDSAQK